MPALTETAAPDLTEKARHNGGKEHELTVELPNPKAVPMTLLAR